MNTPCFLVLDTASNNVLAEFDAYAAAEQYQAHVIAMNPGLAFDIEVVEWPDLTHDKHSLHSQP